MCREWPIKILVGCYSYLTTVHPTQSVEEDQVYQQGRKGAPTDAQLGSNLRIKDQTTCYSFKIQILVQVLLEYSIYNILTSTYELNMNNTTGQCATS